MSDKQKWLSLMLGATMRNLQRHIKRSGWP